MLRAALSKASAFPRFIGPARASQRGYGTSPSEVEMLKMMAKQAVGVKPFFPTARVAAIKDPVLRKKETYREYERYENFSRSGKAFIEDVLRDVAKDTAKDLILSLVALCAALLAALLAAESDMEEAEKEAKAEVEALEKQIKAMEATEEQKKAALKEIQAQYVSWRDWFLGINLKEQLRIKAALAEVRKAKEMLEDELADKRLALAKAREVLAIHDQQRDTYVLSMH